ncbi:Spo0B domain-containing protein [Alkalicella caledoniensis]|uniref:Spo0B domain-containing protein n=1 Tax=Alkalicella caledoniensis TaxID=2731377 RepID=A0A7G9W4I2_ALKCA|nr:Spo0B domain-containing protein [Alkalicella caledoniensis]QNO13594.1 Spo0B domain-containing protein [Alkalicella caledoniensis]
MFLMMILAILLITYLILKIKTGKKLSTIFRHDLYNDLQLVDGYIYLNNQEKASGYLKSAYEKKDLYSLLDKSNLIVQLCYLNIYDTIHKKTSKFNIYIDEKILGKVFFSMSFAKTTIIVVKFLKATEFTNLELDIDSDSIEICLDETIKTFSF